MFYHTSRKASRQDVEAPETFESFRSFKVSASVLEAATLCSHLGQNFERLGLEEMGLVSASAQKVSCTFLCLSLVHYSAIKSASHSVLFTFVNSFANVSHELYGVRLHCHWCIIS